MKNILSIILFVFCSACTNLQEIRDFSSESAKLSAYTELTTRFRNTYEREQAYLSGNALVRARENDERRQAAYGDLIKIHQTIYTYMQTLAKLAGEETFDLSQNIDSLGTGIKAHPEFNIEDKDVDAISNVAKVITKWITASAQEKAVKNMVIESDADLQITLGGMKKLIRYYKKTFENERKTVFGVFETELPFLTPEDKLLTVLSRVLKQSKETEYDNFDKTYDEAEKGIDYIAEGHSKIRENIESLSNVEIRSFISNLSKDIKAVRESLEAIQG